MTEADALAFTASVIEEWRRHRMIGRECRPHAILFLPSVEEPPATEEIETFDLSHFSMREAAEFVRELRRHTSDLWLLLVYEGMEHLSVLGLDGRPISICDAPRRTFGVNIWGPGGVSRRFSGPIGADGRVGEVVEDEVGTTALADIDYPAPIEHPIVAGEN